MVFREKASVSQLVESYGRLGNIWLVAEEFGMCGQSVHERLQKNGIKTGRRFTKEEWEFIRSNYEEHTSTGRLTQLADSMGRRKTAICRAAGILGLTNIRRPKQDHIPRLCSERATARWNSLSEEQKDEWTTKRMTTQARNGNLNPPITTIWRGGWREFGGKRCYYRSMWEANYGRYLEWLKQRGDILEWEHEPITFWFHKIKRGTRTYLPDFRVTELNGRIVYHEVKGWMDERSATKLKRMKIYYPDIVVILIDNVQYRSISLNLGRIVPGWESARDHKKPPRVPYIPPPVAIDKPAKSSEFKWWKINP